MFVWRTQDSRAKLTFPPILRLNLVVFCSTEKPNADLIGDQKPENKSFNNFIICKNYLRVLKYKQAKAKLFRVNYKPLPSLSNFVSEKVGIVKN